VFWFAYIPTKNVGTYAPPAGINPRGEIVGNDDIKKRLPELGR